ncbi:tRNA pseudouridine(55) synthase TruB [Albibacterium indicum]|uniref:tRNA pseudouridine(55) synthase TruB n=1 Tax=Albibacterium indicum TaxID=2292082 RepID=UPI000E488D8E|nr:tRNA pseudouridine(55) synthase TruB [Pedobacter indicus]
MHSKQKDFPEFDFQAGEILLVDKPLRWTSFDVVGKIRNTIKPLKVKVGHAGTLDPLATGLLVLCTGKKTKTIDLLQAQEKEYIGTIYLGATTPSYDLETEIDQRFDINNITDTKIYEAAQQFVGEVQQYPPSHSAIKIGGERLYEKARRGEEVERRPRTVNIHSFEITDIALPLISFKVICSKGTYIRSLANDLGRALHSGAYLHSLRRTRSGEFSVEDAYEVQELVDHIRENKVKEI